MLGSKPTVFVLSLGVFALLAVRFFDHTVDDAFISFRYARNLIDGYGLVFNAAERVEGYTNFLWVLFLAPFEALSLDVEVAARIVGLLATAGALVAVVRLSPKPAEAPELVWIAPLLFVVSPPIAVWATGGLETPLFACLIMWGAVLTIENAEQRTLRPTPALLFAAASLTRPEGMGVALGLFSLLPLLHWKEPDLTRKLLLWLALFLLLVVPHFVWRLAYYGDPLPNTFYAKVGSGPSQLLRGLAYVHHFFVESGYWLLIPLIGLFWAVRRRAVGVLGALVFAIVCFVIAVGGDGLPMYRFLVPALPLLFLLIGHGSAGLVRKGGSGVILRATTSIVLLALVILSAVPAFRGPSLRYVNQDRREVGAWTEIGKFFLTHSRPEDSIAVIPAGAMPYFSKLVAIDMLGLNDRTIARRQMPNLGEGQAGHEKYDVDYVLSREPTYIVVGVYGLWPQPVPPHKLVQPVYAAEIEMLKSESFRANYVPVLGQTASGYFAYFRRSVE